VDGQTVWVASVDGRLRSIDVDTGAVRVRATTELVTRIRVGQGLWPMTFDGKVLRLDRRTGRVVARVSGSFKAADLAVGAEGVWVYDQRQGAVVRIDPRTTGLSGPSGRSASRWWSPTPASLRSGTGRSGWSARAVRPLSGSTRTADPAGPVLGLRRPS
jgi:anaerobic selenocysteine-containing dehydrogenase